MSWLRLYEFTVLPHRIRNQKEKKIIDTRNVSFSFFVCIVLYSYISLKRVTPMHQEFGLLNNHRSSHRFVKAPFMLLPDH